MQSKCDQKQKQQVKRATRAQNIEEKKRKYEAKKKILFDLGRRYKEAVLYLNPLAAVPVFSLLLFLGRRIPFFSVAFCVKII